MQLDGLAIPAFLMLIIAMLIVPMPVFLLDILFTLNIVLGLMIIMISINVTKPLEFSAFPSLLLLTTMLRLSLNVASTRVVLVNGHEGSGAAGKVIEAFGDFVIASGVLRGIQEFVEITFDYFNLRPMSKYVEISTNLSRKNDHPGLRGETSNIRSLIGELKLRSPTL